MIQQENPRISEGAAPSPVGNIKAEPRKDADDMGLRSIVSEIEPSRRTRF